MSITIQPAIHTPANDTSLPTANWANVNAMELFRAVGIPADPGGEIEHADLDAFVAKVDRLLLGGPGGRLRAPMLRADEESGGDGRCRVFSCGSDDESAQRRLSELRSVLVWARDNGLAASWG